MIENEIQSVCLPPSSNVIIEPPVTRAPELEGDNEHVSRLPELEDDDHVSREFPDYPQYPNNGRKSNFKYAILDFDKNLFLFLIKSCGISMLSRKSPLHGYAQCSKIHEKVPCGGSRNVCPASNFWKKISKYIDRS